MAADLKTVTFEICHDDGKRFRIEGRFPDGRAFVMQPIGEITAHEAKVICRGLLNAGRAAEAARAAGVTFGAAPLPEERS